MISIPRYWRTLRHLKPVQLYGRAWYRLCRPVADARQAPPLRASRLDAWRPPARKPPRMLGPTAFRFLNCTARCATAADWENPERDKLWLYNLHYFDDLASSTASARAEWHAALIARWIAENPPAVGTGWEAYPTSLRIVNWVKWALAGNELTDNGRHSLAVQARWLAGRIEHHLLANHLLANAKALVFAGLYFDGPEAARWRDSGMRLLERELHEQILVDGAHFELSPMYHDIILEDVLDVINIAATYPAGFSASAVADLRATAARMLAWGASILHPDGEIPFFNDAAFDIAASPADLAEYAARLGVSARHVETSASPANYVRLERGGAVVIADVAPIGADYQPAHAHADTLSFELSVGRHRVFVNSGTSTYRAGPQRRRERSTAAHNTVSIDGSDSTEVWGAFRVGRRARVCDLIMYETGDGVVLAASHDGFRHLNGHPIHERRWHLEPDRLRVIDCIHGDFRSATARFYLHPAVVASPDGVLRLPDGTSCRWQAVGGTPRIVESQWHPEFGGARPNRCIELDFDGHELTLDVRWEPIGGCRMAPATEDNP